MMSPEQDECCVVETPDPKSDDAADEHGDCGGGPKDSADERSVALEVLFSLQLNSYCQGQVSMSLA